ncbi:hypothetical protein MVES1_002771 [Malassezia vespertilionis]|uniref:uncharacterized protein n=1 Tax=Malassezia vespertilionis TaxID=2020962 RepID=UPI0024B14BCA|nr:uncharacterized protein MVES1_002771 [Malassezia vespertilionis]WFD07407.1 hypothetical protein MVES1_002771 [Malassezia vespertilionis]
MPPRRGGKKKHGAPRRAPRPASEDESGYSSEEGPHMPRVLDMSDDEPEALQGDDEEIDSDEAFGDSDDERMYAGHSARRKEEPSDFEDDEGDDLVALSTLLDGAADEVQDEQEDVSDGEDLAELVAQRTKRNAEDLPVKPAKMQRMERTELVPESADALHAGGQLALEDLMANGTLSSQVRALAETRRSELQPVASRKGGGTLHAPLPGVVQERMDRQAAYALTKEEVQGWAPTVKRLREAEHLSFPLQKPAQLPAPSTAGLTASFAPSNDMERDVANVLQESGLTEKQIAEQEGLALKALDPHEAAKRQSELRYMRELMFRMEQKAKRAKKIKSKSYRRVHRKERERLQGLAELEDKMNSDDEEERALKAAQARAKERATLRHKNTGKWAKAHLGRNDESSVDARLALEEQLQRGDQLRQRVHVEDSESDEEEGDIDPDAAFDELQNFENAEVSRDRALEEQIQAAGKQGKVFQMKFMKDARDRQARSIYASVDELHDALEREEESDGAEENIVRLGRSGRAVYGPGKKQTTRDESSEDVDDTTQFSRSTAAPCKEKPPHSEPAAEPVLNPWLADEASHTFSKKRNTVLVGKDSHAATLAAHRQARHKARSDEAREADVDDATLEIDPSAHMTREESDEEPVEVVHQHKRGKRGQRKTGTTMLPVQNRALVAEAFAGDDVALEFAKQKRASVRAEAPKQLDMTLPGWGAWGGKGARRKPKQSEHVRRTTGLDPSKRKDREMDHVLINERVDKKAEKYKAKDLPFPYTSASQYEAAMRTPLGSEWNTRTQHQRLTLPRVATKLGQRIDPIQRKF